jgi:hypothetical protein
VRMLNSILADCVFFAYERLRECEKGKMQKVQS